MATKKSNARVAKPAEVKSTLTKIAETIGEVAAEISIKADQVSGMATHAIDTVKAKIHNITAPNVKKKVTANKQLTKKVKTVQKKLKKKVAKPVTKKVASTKKICKG